MQGGRAGGAGKGVENTSTCKTFPINLGIGFYGVSAGTTAGMHGKHRTIGTTSQK